MVETIRNHIWLEFQTALHISGGHLLCNDVDAWGQYAYPECKLPGGGTDSIVFV